MRLTADFAAPLVAVRRGDIVESWHRGHIVAVDGTGALVVALGQPETVTYLRSASKPQQALPLVTSGAADSFGFTAAELALACGSHNGDPVHTSAVRAMLQKTGLDESALQCGAHEPYGPATARLLRAAGLAPRPIHNNCSGKHAGMLALARHWGASLETYRERSHPVQIAAAEAIAQFAGVAPESLAVGLDGCGVPTFGVTVRQMALMFARLIMPPPEWRTATRQATQRLVQAMLDFPEMVGGATDAHDTALMRVTQGRLLAKAGAEGVFTCALKPCQRWPQGLAVALKIEDGDGARRARRPAVMEALRQLEALHAEEIGLLAEYAGEVIYNRRGDVTGQVCADFELTPAAWAK